MPEPIAIPSEPDDTRRSSNLRRCVLPVIVLAGFAVRLWGHRFGLPFLYHEDEAVIVDRALRMPIDGPNPYWFAYPTLTIYLQAFVTLAVFAGKWLVGTATTYAAFVQSNALDPSAVYSAGRTLTAFLGAATIGLVAAATMRLGSLDERDARTTSLAAAFLLAFDALHVEHSHYITTDVPLAFAGALVLLASARLAVVKGGGSVRQYIVAGAATGVAAAMKYPGALFAVLIVAVYAQSVDWRDWRSRLTDRRLPAAALASIAAFVACSPFVLLNYGGFVRDVAVEANHMRQGHLGFETAGNHYVTLLGGLSDYGDAGLLLLFAVGAIAFAVRKDVFGRALVVTVVLLFAIAGTSNVLFTRYMLPLLPAVAIVAARGAMFSAELTTRRPGFARAAGVAVVVAITVALPGYLIAHRLRLFSGTDTRTIARAWVDRTFADAGPALLAVEWKSIPKGPMPIVGIGVVDVEYDVDRMVHRGVRYVAVTDRMYRRYLKAPSVYPDQGRFYRDLLGRGLLVEVFSPFDDASGQLAQAADGSPVVVKGAVGRPWTVMPRRTVDGPVIMVFDLGQAAAPAAPVEAAAATAVEPPVAGDE